MTTTTITDANKYRSRFLDIEPSVLVHDGLFIGVKEHEGGSRRGIHLDEDKARELIAAVTKHFGKKILKAKTVAEINRERFDKIPVGARFEYWVEGGTPGTPDKALKISETEFKHVDRDGTTSTIPSSIGGHHIWPRIYNVIPEPTVAEQIKALAVGDQFTIHFLDRPIKGIKIDADSYFRYDENRIVKLAHELGTSKVVKSS